MVVITLSIFLEVFSTSVCPLLYCGWLVDFSVLFTSYSFIFFIQEVLYWIYKLIILADVKGLAKGKSFHYKQKSKRQKEHLKVPKQ